MLLTSPSRNTLPATDPEQLFQVFQAAYLNYLDSAQMPAADRPVLVEEYPKLREGQFDHRFDVILMSIASSRMAPTGPGGRIPVGPQMREIPHPDKAGYTQATLFWWEDVAVRFDILAKSNSAANRLANWFHRRFMMQYGPVLKYFEARGIKNLQFVERGPDARSKDDYSQELYIRPLTYTMRITLLETAERKTLDHLTIQLAETVPLELSGSDGF